MIVPMFDTGSYTLIKRRQTYFVWLVALCIWLASVGISTHHLQEHIFLDDSECQLCISNFKHTPFIISDDVPFLSYNTVYFKVKLVTYYHQSSQPLTVSNRDPPIFNS